MAIESLSSKISSPWRFGNSPDSLANPAALNAFSYRIDHACAVAVRDDPWRRKWPTHPALDVRRIDAGYMHANS
jgi:hypothetical protein